MTENTQLTSTKNYDTDNIIFSDPVCGSIPDSKPKIEFKRINISTKNADGTIGELVFPTERLFSFGVSENKSQETGKVNGYTFPLCLWNKNGASEQEKQWTDTFNNVVDRCIDHLVEIKEEIDMFELTKGDLTKSKGGLNPLYWKKEKAINDQGRTVLRVVPGTGPTLYTKLIFSKKHNKFLSQFFNLKDEPLNALELMGKYCFVNAAVKIESIFIGSRISLQVKLYEAVIEPQSMGPRRLLRSRPKSKSKVLEMKNSSISQLMENNSKDNSDSSDSDDDTSVISSSDDEVAPTPKKKIIKKKIVRLQ